MAAFAAVQLAHEIDDPDAVIVVLLPDSGRGYLGKVFDDEWLGQYGFLSASGNEQTVGEVLRGKSGQIPDLVHTHPNETIAQAVHILQEYGVSQMPVVRAEPPIVAAEVAGSVSERRLLDALYSSSARLVDSVEKHMDEPLPTAASNEPVSEAVTRLQQGADALLVQEDGKPIGVVTRQDLLAYLANRSPRESVLSGSVRRSRTLRPHPGAECPRAPRRRRRVEVFVGQTRRWRPRPTPGRRAARRRPPGCRPARSTGRGRNHRERTRPPRARRPTRRPK